jgi:class 3 adenylate cyclase
LVSSSAPGESNQAQKAIKAAELLLWTAGHDDPGLPWIPVGVGLRTNTVFVDKVGGEGVTNLTVLGDVANIADRLIIVTEPGEVLISDSMLAATGLDLGQLEERHLQLRDRTQPVNVRALSITAERASTSTS